MASNSYYGFTHGGTLHSSNSAPAYQTPTTAYPAGAAASSAYPPPPPPPAPANAYDQGYPSGGTVQYPGVTVSSDYGYGAPVGAPAGFENAPYYPAAYYQSSTQPAYQTPEPVEQKPTATTTAGSMTSNSTAGNPWNKPKNAAGVLGTRERSGPKPFRGGMGGGGGRFRSSFGTGGASHPPRPEQLLYCDTCKISCAGPQAYKEHLAGQKHKKKEVATKAGASATLPKGGSALHCELCDITCTGSDAYAAHIRGSKHQKVVKLHQKLGKPIPSNEPTIISNTPSKNAAPNGKSNEAAPVIGPVKPAETSTNAAEKDNKTTKQVVESLTGQKVNIPKLPDELDVEPVGETYIEEIREGGKIITFNCKLCDCKFTDPNAKEMHLKGRRHRLQYKKKVDPSLEVLDKQSAKSKQLTMLRAEKLMPAHPAGGPRRGLLGNTPGEFGRMRMMEEGDRRYWDENWGMFGNGGPRFGPPGPGFGPPMGPRSMGAPPHPPSLMNMPPVPAPPFFGMGPPPRMGPGQGPQQPGWMSETISDRYVGAKHANLYPEEEELTAVQRLVANVEKALKMVSDVLAESSAKDGDANKGKTEAHRILKGVMRVGILAKCLLLKGEREVELVVLCAEKPTRTLLQKVLATLPKQLSVVHGGTELYNLEQLFDEAAIRISTFKEPKSVVTVTFTSFLMRPENVDPKSTDTAKPDPPDVLNKERCLEALAKLRHSKWYQAKANCVRHCTMIIRILRDFCVRESAWACVKEWPLELLVQRALESVPGEPLSAGESLKRVFECVAGGWLLPGGLGLIDPCEKNDVDAAAYLTPQQKQDITAAAQVALRRIAFRSLHQVLDMPEKLQPEKRSQIQPGRKRRLEPEDQSGDKTGKPAVVTPLAAVDKKTKVEPNDPEVVVKVEST